MSNLIKICGLREETAIAAAHEAGCDFLGFVFFPRSPRHLDLQEAKLLKPQLPTEIKAVALMVNPTKPFIDEIMNVFEPDIIQFHGQERVQDLEKFKSDYPAVGIWKAFGVSSHDDIRAVEQFESVADLFLFDAKPPKSASRPGGHGTQFDWSLISDYSGHIPFLLAGGLDIQNINDAIQSVKTHPQFAGVDVSSGVERELGQKDPSKIKHFIDDARRAMDGV